MAKRVNPNGSGNPHIGPDGLGDPPVNPPLTSPPPRSIGEDLTPPITTPPRNVGNTIVLPTPNVARATGTKTTDGSYNNWPLSKFSFKVNIGGFTQELEFQGMDGLGATIATMKFRDANSSKFYEQSRPTLTSFEPVTLKKGVFPGDSNLFDWFKNVSQGAFFSDMRTVTITLTELQGAGNHVSMFVWTLEGAYVTKFTPSGLDAESDSEVAIEEVELTYQSFSLTSNLFGGMGGALGAVLNAVF